MRAERRDRRANIASTCVLVARHRRASATASTPRLDLRRRRPRRPRAGPRNSPRHRRRRASAIAIGLADAGIGAGHQRLLPDQRPPLRRALGLSLVTRCRLAFVHMPIPCRALLSASAAAEVRARRAGDERHRLLLAIDQGTTSTRAILFDAAGQEHHSRASRTAPASTRGRAGSSTTRRRSGARSSRPAAPPSPRRAMPAGRAIGITNQRETAVLWERATGRPVHNAIVWQDRRTADICERWRDAGLAETVARAHRAGASTRISQPRRSAGCSTSPGLRAARRGRRDRVRHDRQLSAVAADRRPAARDRCHQRVAHDAVRPAPARLGRRTARRLRHPARDVAGGARHRRRFRRDRARAVRPGDPDRRGRRRPAGGG